MLNIAIRETQIRTTVRYQLTPVRMAIFKKTADKTCWWECREKRHCVHIRAVTMQNSVKVPQKTKSRTTTWSSNSSPEYISEDNENTSLKGYVHSLLFIVALFMIAQIWKQPKCPSTDKWIKMWHIYTHIYTHIWRWHPTPVFLPGESQGRGSLVGGHLWGRTESDTTEAT